MEVALLEREGRAPVLAVLFLGPAATVNTTAAATTTTTITAGEGAAAAAAAEAEAEATSAWLALYGTGAAHPLQTPLAALLGAGGKRSLFLPARAADVVGLRWGNHSPGAGVRRGRGRAVYPAARHPAVSRASGDSPRHGR
jgi:hypothetical protein